MQSHQKQKGAIVALPYGVEGFAPLRHLVKQDGTAAKADEKLDFKVLEFSKDSKKIILSHTKTFEKNSPEERPGEIVAAENKEKEVKKPAAKKKGIEKSTLGDIDALSNLKSAMDAEKESAKKSKE